MEIHVSPDCTRYVWQVPGKQRDCPPWIVIQEESRPLSEIRSLVPTFCDFEIDAQVSPGCTVYVLPERQTVLAGGVVVLENKTSITPYRGRNSGATYTLIYAVPGVVKLYDIPQVC
jgi:hypothetical protein